MNRLSKEIKNKLIEEAKEYEAYELDSFLAEIGWEDWMNGFTDAKEGDPISEEEGEEINKILKEIFKLAHPAETEKEDNEYTQDELEDALYDFYYSCRANGYDDMEECAKYFCEENDHMNINDTEISEILKKIDKAYN